MAMMHILRLRGIRNRSSSGKDEWKSEPRSDLYDSAFIESRLEALREARSSNDPRQMMFILRSGSLVVLIERIAAEPGEHRQSETLRVCERWHKTDH